MAPQIPRHAFYFTKTFISTASRHGVANGLKKAAAGANPLLMSIEAASAVLGAVDSYLKLRQARAHRDGLKTLIPKEEKRLELEREALAQDIDLARREMQHTAIARQAVGRMMLSCVQLTRHCLDELALIRSSELPDLQAFEETLERLMEADQGLRRSMEYFNSSTACVE
ncbi:hypothetical protein [Pseudomonas citronellolis]|uniref:hypothetical protein n=1 Tax=Pseudomonas citronellolis TaxID=53408 RepID=UPI0023E3D39A|nr:hypothetical protein [Pseudomonas citronellolis]MDF3932197.1 hypothetical protein [Pseudomonas citronellolis]